MRYEEPLFL